MMFVFRDHKLRFRCGRSSYSSLKAFESCQMRAQFETFVEISFEILEEAHCKESQLNVYFPKRQSIYSNLFIFRLKYVAPNSHVHLISPYFHVISTNVPFMSIFMFLKNWKRSILDKVSESAIKSPELKESNILFFLASRTENEK